jgi:hypothetical protein
MYGLPQDFDGLFFVGRELEIVSYTADSIFSGFGNDISVTTESSYECRLVGDEEYVETQQPPVAFSRLMQLVGCKVASVGAEQQGTLTLHFDEGHAFRCFDDQPSYESYRIAHGKEEIFV